METALLQTRSELQRLSSEETPWYTAFDEAGRMQQRELGRQLFAGAVDLIGQPDRRPELLQQARKLGRHYAANALQYNISLLETIPRLPIFPAYPFAGAHLGGITRPPSG